MAQLPLVLVYHGTLQIATFWEWLAIYFHHSVVGGLGLIEYSNAPLVDRFFCVFFWITAPPNSFFEEVPVGKPFFSTHHVKHRNRFLVKET